MVSWHLASFPEAIDQSDCLDQSPSYRDEPQGVFRFYSRSIN
jgi:hypothetical protein